MLTNYSNALNPDKNKILEVKMNKNQSKHYKHLLQQHREHHREVMEDMSRGISEEYGVLEDSELSRYDNHPSEVATELFDAEQLAALKFNREFAIREIDSALEKIESNTYGLCETCSKFIEPERLEVLPHAKNCIECERLQEYEKSIDKQCKSKHRPVEEDVLEKEMRGDYIHDLNGDEPYDGEQALEEVLSFGSSDSPQVGAPLGNRQDAAENDRSIREIEDVDQISNEMYKKQLQ